MADYETHKGKTPNGGVRSVAYFMDAQGNPVDKEVATRVEIIELAEDGSEVGRTYGEITHG